jgi:hypothetical protein
MSENHSDQNSFPDSARTADEYRPPIPSADYQRGFRDGISHARAIIRESIKGDEGDLTRGAINRMLYHLSRKLNRVRKDPVYE